MLDFGSGDRRCSVRSILSRDIVVAKDRPADVRLEGSSTADASTLRPVGRRVRRMGGDEPLDVEELVRENRSLREQRQAVDEVLRAVARSEGLQPVLDAIIEAATRLCHGKHGQLYLAEGDVFLIVSQVATLAESYDYAAEHPHLRDRTTVVGRTALAGEAVQIADVLADPEYSFGGQAIVGYRALLGVPVILDDRLIGVVTVGRNVPGLFADREVELVKTFADQAAIAIANARLLDTVERQRTELSRFLSPQVAALISSEQGEQLLAGHRAYITCLFSDLRGSRRSPRRLRPRSSSRCSAHTTR